MCVSDTVNIQNRIRIFLAWTDIGVGRVIQKNQLDATITIY